MTEQEQQLAVNADELATVESDRDDLLAERERLLGEPAPPKGMAAEQAMPKNGDVSERASDGVRAIRFDHPWGPYTDESGVKHTTTYILWMGNRVFYNTLDKLEGDDWQPLHSAADHAAEVKRLTAELAEARAGEAKAKREGVEAIQWMVEQSAEMKRLTARVAELEEELRDQGWMDSMCCCTGDCDHDSAHECLAWIRSQLDERCNSIREILATAPLPTAGDEGESWAWSKEDIERRKKVAAWVEATDPAPAEPDSPAEERSAKRGFDYCMSCGGDLDTGWECNACGLDWMPWAHFRPDAEEREELRAEVETLKRLCGEVVGVHTIGSYCKDVRSNKFGEVAEKIMQHFDRGNQEEHRKPSCLDGVPAVLCDWEATPGECIRGWAFDSIFLGFVRYRDFEDPTMLHGDVHVSAITPIHHDPTDAAAVELAGRIAEGGGG